MVKKNYITKFLIWRYKHVSDKNLVLFLSVLVGFLAGLVSVILKNSTHYIQLLIGKITTYFHQPLYFTFPIIGLLLVYILNKYLRHNV